MLFNFWLMVMFVCVSISYLVWWVGILLYVIEPGPIENVSMYCEIEAFIFWSLTFTVYTQKKNECCLTEILTSIFASNFSQIIVGLWFSKSPEKHLCIFVVVGKDLKFNK